MDSVDNVCIDLVQGQHVRDAATIAKEGYNDSAEAPSVDELNYYQLVAGHLFLGYFIDGTLVAYICGIRVYGNDLYMNNTVHLPRGDTILIKSICTDVNFRHMGIASHLLRSFVEHVFECQHLRQEEFRFRYRPDDPPLSRVIVLTPARFIPLFTRSGFSLRFQACYKSGRIPYYECEFYYNPHRRAKFKVTTQTG